MENTQEENERKGEAMLTKFGAIKKIGVYCYTVSIESANVGGTISQKYENRIIIGNNEEQLEEQTEWRQEDQEGYADLYDYTLIYSAEFHSDEVMERFDLRESKIEEILEGENLELDDWDLDGTDYFDECALSMEEIIEKRRIDSEPFDADEIISKIASEYVLTTKRKSALLKSIGKLQ